MPVGVDGDVDDCNYWYRMYSSSEQAVCFYYSLGASGIGLSMRTLLMLIVKVLHSSSSLGQLVVAD